MLKNSINFDRPMQTFGNPLHTIDTVDSTNNYAMQRVHARLAKHGETIVAMQQTAGKGQRGKSWTSTRGESILMSVVAEPRFLPLAASFRLSAAVALACHDFLSSLSQKGWSIKWPNDLYWNDRKAGGILIENRIAGPSWEYAVIGIGININQTHFDPALPNPVSLHQVTGETFDVRLLVPTLLACLDRRYASIPSTPWTTLLSEYNSSLYRHGNAARFRQGSRAFDALVKGVSEDGRLRLQAGGIVEEFSVGEIEWEQTKNPSVETEGYN